MTTRTFDLPDLGEGLTEAEVVRWLVAVGEDVEVDQPVVEVETAKAVVEVPSPFAGRVSALHGDEGRSIDVGRPLISVDEVGTAVPAGPAERYREEERAGSGNVLIGYGTSGDEVRGRRRPRRGAVPPGAVSAAVPATPTARSVPRVVSPLVRRRARDAGLSVTGLVGTGADGLITRRDVEAAIALAAAGAPTALAPDAPAPAVPAGASVDGAPHPRTGLPAVREPMSGFRRAVSAALTRSRSEVPEATVWVDVDFTELFALRAQAREASSVGEPTPVPGLLAYLARFTVAALRRHPELNGEVDVERQELVRFDGVNLGVAVQSERGLVVPAVVGAEAMTTTELDVALRRLTASAREGRSTPTELTCGTFTLNNYGAFGVDGSAAIIHHPQVAILGFGRVIDRPWVVDGRLEVRKIAQMSFVFDHRVCDGGTAAAFMRQVADAVENPVRAIAHL